MDLVKTLLIYMMLAVGAAAEATPSITPPPAAPDTTVTPTAHVIVLPTMGPSMVPTFPPTQAPTASPTPTVYTTLYVGDRGEEVKKMQRRLAELGYLTDKIDGIYGQNTKRAVERFQYYNDLTVDGIAGKATQRELYENPRVVTAPPDITPGPTPTATPVRTVNVPVYYVDQDGRLLSQTSVACTGTATIYANSSYVPQGYTLTSQSSYNVTVRNGIASPASVTFRYRLSQPPTAAPTSATVPVYYLTDTGVILYQTAVTLPTGKTTAVYANIGLVPEYYQLTSASIVNVYVDSKGSANPASVVFSFRNNTPTPKPETKLAQIPVRYIDETGMLLNETIVTIEYGQSISIYASAGMVGENYRLISQNPVYASVSKAGEPNPAVVFFTYVYQAPTNPPTNPPTDPPPTIPPTNPPTDPPTDPPPTNPPTDLPTVPPTVPPTNPPTDPPPTNPPTNPPTDPPPTNPPTNPPTDPPAPPEKQELTRQGGTVIVNGSSYSVNWYRTGSGRVAIGLVDVCQCLGYSQQGKGSLSVLGHTVAIDYSRSGINSLSIDGRSYLSSAIIYNNYPYVDEGFLSGLGLSVSASGGDLYLSY